MIADPTAVVTSRPLPHAPLTGAPIADRSGVAGAAGAVVSAGAVAGLRMIFTASQPSPTVVASGRAVASRVRAGASVTVAPGGGVKVNRAGSCAPKVRSLKPTCSAGSAEPVASTVSRSGIRFSASTATRTSRSRVRSVGAGVSTSS